MTNPPENTPQNPWGPQSSSPNGQPASDPYGQPAYAQAQQPYSQDPNAMANPYAGYGQSQYAQMPAISGWFKRVGANIIDSIPGGLLGGVASSFAPTTDPDTGAVVESGNIGLMLVFLLAAFAFTLWNRWLRAGKTGQSIGKQALGMRLLSEADGQPIGAGRAFLRDLAHILDGIFNIGYIVAAFDSKKQTFADKIMKTVVVDAQ